MYGLEILGSEDGSKETDKIQERFCKKVLRIPTFAANAVAKPETEQTIGEVKYCFSLVFYWEMKQKWLMYKKSEKSDSTAKGSNLEAERN
jgi:hypothetical protein